MAVRLALVVAAALLALLGSAGLSTIQKGSDCGSGYPDRNPAGVEKVIGSQELSVWPPGIICDHEVKEGLASVQLPDTGGDIPAFLILVALALTAFVMAATAGPDPPRAVKAAAATMAGLMLFGASILVGLPAGAMLGLILTTIGGYETARRLTEVGRGQELSKDGVLGASASFLALGLGTLLWIAGLGPAGFVLVAGGFVAMALASRAFADPDSAADEPGLQTG